jgi:hypothetical protein
MLGTVGTRKREGVWITGTKTPANKPCRLYPQGNDKCFKEM